MRSGAVGGCSSFSGLRELGRTHRTEGAPLGYTTLRADKKQVVFHNARESPRVCNRVATPPPPPPPPASPPPPPAARATAAAARGARGRRRRRRPRRAPPPPPKAPPYRG